jgi:predicted signal transduction protein with EAL and GGDEF domain
MEFQNTTVAIGASFGVAIFPDDAEDGEALSIAADLRMYENKRSSYAGQSKFDAGQQGSSVRASNKPETSGPERKM